MSMLPVALNAVIPLFLLIFLGYFLTRIGFFSQDFLKIANKLCFRILMPVNMFWTMYNGRGMWQSVMIMMAGTCMSPWLRLPCGALI